MCEKIKRTYQGMRRDFIQWSIHWLQFDKIRPGLIISNNWYNATQNKVLAVPITSVDKSDNKYSEWDYTCIPFINHSSDINYIKVANIKWFDMRELSSDTNKLIGFLTDEIVKSKITDFVSNICNPMYKAEEISYEYQVMNGTIKNNFESEINHATVKSNEVLETETKTVSNISDVNETDLSTSKTWSRKKKSRPDNFVDIYQQYISKQINSSQACEKLNVSYPTFWRMKKAYEKELSNISDEVYPLNDLTPIYNQLNNVNIKETLDKVSKINIFENNLEAKETDNDDIIKALSIVLYSSPSKMSKASKKFNSWKNIKIWTNIAINYCFDNNLITDDLFIQIDDFLKDRYKSKMSL